MRPSSNRPRIAIVGAGFGGMQAARSLATSNAEIVLIDRNNYNTFVPLLYQVAAAQIAPDRVAHPILPLLGQRAGKIHFLQADVKRIDLARQVLETDSTVIPYDYAILATGSRTRFLGIAGAAEYAFPLQTLEQAVTLRNHLFGCFEQAARAGDRQTRRRLLTVAIVGGGPTGVEVAGTLVELRRSLRQNHPEFDLQELQIVLVQAGDRLLGNLPEPLGRYTARKLQRHGVELYLQTKVGRIAATAIEFEDGSSLSAGTVIWAAGLEAALPDLSARPETATRQRLRVRPTLQLLDSENVYAIGDVAHADRDSKPPDGVAPEALQQGITAARNISRQLRGKAPQSFHYLNKGRLAIVGCYGGTGKVGPLLLTGFLPWLMWLSVHLVYLPGFRNRLFVLLSWFRAYGLGDRAILPYKRIATRQSSPSNPVR